MTGEAWIAPVGTSYGGIINNDDWKPLGKIVAPGILMMEMKTEESKTLLSSNQARSITVSGQMSVELWDLFTRPGSAFLPGPKFVQFEKLGMADKCEHWRDRTFPVQHFDSNLSWWLNRA